MRRRATSLMVAVATLLLGAPAIAQNDLEVGLSHSKLEPDGRTELVVTVDAPELPDDSLPPESFSVFENGQPIEGLRVAPLLEEEEPPPSTVMILFDISGSARGEPLAAAQDGASELARTVTAQGAAVGLVPFSSEATVAVPPTEDAEEVVAAIDGLEAEGRTALYDAIVLASGELEDREGDRSLVLFTDGGDNESAATLNDAIQAAVSVDAPLINVALITSEQDPDVLDALAEGTEGQLLEVAELEQLQSTFEQVAEALTAGYILRYDSDDLRDEIDLAIEVQHDGREGRYQAVLLNPRVEAEEESLPEPAPVGPAVSDVLTQPAWLYGALLAVFLGFLIAFWYVFVPTTRRLTERTLRRGMSAVPNTGFGSGESTSSAAASTFGRATIDLVARAPRPAGYDQRLQVDIDRAGWNMRSSEFTALRVMGALLGFLLLWALSNTALFGLIGGVTGFMIPALLLSTAKSRRQKRFMQQLPDTLQLLAGTLKAGYGVLQAIDTIVKEVEDPTSSEFQRALTEARLGLPLEVSLGDMADRIDSDDFRWVVLAMNIQRQVGGNLAELLETVAATLRGREQVRRQITTLSAEGRLSAIILIALPFVLIGYLLIINPGFLLPLITTPFGLLMLAGAGLLMIVGVFWIRRLIAIDV
jgi:tight adherence protein B